MKKLFFLILSPVIWASCTTTRRVTVEILNPGDFPRNYEVVEIDFPHFLP